MFVNVRTGATALEAKDIPHEERGWGEWFQEQYIQGMTDEAQVALYLGVCLRYQLRMAEVRSRVIH